MRWIVLFAVLAGLSLAAFAAPFGKSAPDLRIYIRQADGAELSVQYEWRKPRREMIFESVAGGYRERRWEIATPGFKLVRLEDEDRIVRTDGKKFSDLELTAKPDLVRIPKEYQPTARYGAGGALIFTGHFWPMTGKGGRVNATFDFTPAEGGHVVTFGANEPALSDWRSPMAHPAFVYMGPLDPVETDHVMALIDPDAPRWIVDEFNTLVPASFDKLATLFGFSPETKPNLFLAAPLGRDEGRLSYAGDALPAQFQITLEGAAWKQPSDKARGIFVNATIHEAVHLWQAAARPGVEDAPEWIHEGAADAIAAEVMVALGEWDGGAFAANERAARRECASELETGSLNGAKARGDFRALYACGHVIALAVSRADGETTADFWRVFIERAGDDGYSEDMFYDLVAERTGDRDFADAVEDFARTPLAEPARAIDGLFASSASLARERGR
ncbi:hypothetical protein ACFOOP_16505 [Marinicaulis aureus]|uniref:Peptidase M61 catalytic domain-containing protein n=1 Tax=Hyphococcus aureus TaxID=2666033 RepID=A0ABW1L0U3_9PROT